MSERDAVVVYIRLSSQMIRTACLLLFAVITYATQGQAWRLFPLDQRSYYTDTVTGYPDGREQVGMRLMDSVKTTAQGDIHYFRKKLGVDGIGDCTTQDLEALPLEINPDPWAMDSLVEQNDTAFYHRWGVASPFYFLPKASVGQSWTVLSTYGSNTYADITITCTGITQETFMGIADSVKTFSMTPGGSDPQPTPVSTFTMRLSKFHGLLEYVPFELFLVHPPYADFETLRLIGFENASGSFGFHPPGFDDFFHPLVGDVLFWEEYADPYSFIDPPWTRYHLDTITDVTWTSDSVVVQYDRTRQNEDYSQTYLPGQTRTFARHGWANLLNCPPNWIGPGRFELDWNYLPNLGELLWGTGPLDIWITAGGNDTIVGVGFGTNLSEIDTTTCQTIEAWDWWYSVSLDSRAGVTQHCQNFSTGSHCFTLIGSIIGGEQQGNITLSATQEHERAPGHLDLFPNPVSDQLHLRGAPCARVYEVLDVEGRVVLHGNITNGTVSTGQLYPGTYLLQVRTEAGIERAWFVRD